MKYGDTNVVEVSTDGCKNVDDFVEAVKKELEIRSPPQEISISVEVGGVAMRRGMLINEIPDIDKNHDENPLFVIVNNAPGPSTAISKLTIGTVVTKDLNKDVVVNYLKSCFQKRRIILSDTLTRAKFHDNCLEYRLDKRETNYVPNDANNVKIVLAVSGAGKTRMLLELLYSNFGYYFITKSSVQDFGSQDLRSCHNYCDSKPLLVRTVIQQLYFVRATICAFLQENGFKKPWQILLAQLHPKEIFGFDIFNKVFQHIMKGNYDNPVFEEPYPFCAIDEIQISVESEANYSVPGARNKRPFFSPLVLFSKLLYIFPLFIVVHLSEFRCHLEEFP